MYSGKRDHRDAGDQHRVREHGQPGPILDHSVLHLALDEAELHDGERDDDDHQDHRLRGGAAEVRRPSRRRGRPCRPGSASTAPARPRGRVDDAEGVEERVDDVDDEQEERGRREQRKHDREEAPHRSGAVDRRRLDQRFRNRLQPGEEEQEVVADLFPDRGDAPRAACAWSPSSNGFQLMPIAWAARRSRRRAWERTGTATARRRLPARPRRARSAACCRRARRG